MPILIKHLSLRHQNRLGIAGTLTKTAANDAQEGLNNHHFSIFQLLKNVLRTNLNTFAAAVA